MGNPIICLLQNFTGYVRYTQATISLDKQFLKPKEYAARAFECLHVQMFNIQLFVIF